MKTIPSRIISTIAFFVLPLALWQAPTFAQTSQHPSDPPPAAHDDKTPPAPPAATPGKSDAAAKPPTKWILGMGYEFQQRTDGLIALNSAYHLNFSGPPKTMDLGLLYQALEQKQVSMIAANASPHKPW